MSSREGGIKRGGGEFHLQFNPVLIVRMGSINWKILFRMGVVTPQNFRSVTDPGDKQAESQSGGINRR